MDDIFKQQFSHIKIPLFERWREEGRVEGRQEGRQEALSQIALLQLHKKFEQLSKSVEESVRALPTKQLEQLSVDLLEFAKPQDLTQWLRKHAAKEKK